ncbi:CPBP family intramembrane glutamic endopeptidase [Apilactobacillus quenuiae]|uniref:CPBP family intramembrane glutamic endopeptidase n=1 Tax=Apilactobacillus quenuiae TaxID=2008377 RepID=UPI000D014FDA|nr:CPBP family intramembrane glutamic endopeptidase [Apilactobacillus quenuiae]
MIKKDVKATYFIILILINLIFSELVSQIILGMFSKIITSNIVLDIIKYIILSILSISIYAFIYKYICKYIYKTKFKMISIKPKFKLIYLIAPMVLIILTLLSYFTINGKFITNNSNINDIILNLSSTIFMGTITAPLLEEVTFRGVILNIIGKNSNYKLGIILSGFLFGIMHLLNGVNNLNDGILLVLSGTIMGSLLGLIAYLTKTIWSSFYLHATFNLITSLVPISLSKINNWPFVYKMLNNNNLLSGGSSGFQSSIISMFVYVLTGIAFIIVYKHQNKNKI